MGDFQHASAPNQQVPAQKIHTEEDLTHQKHGVLGDMSVVPDDYVGPMPPGAVRQTDYHRMESVYGNIAAGTSSIQFDTSSFFKTEDGKNLSLLDDPLKYVTKIAEAAQFKQQYMGYLQEVVKTPAGLKMLEQLGTSKHQTKIARGNGGNVTGADNYDAVNIQKDGSRSAGTGSTISVDPTLANWDAETCQTGPLPWMDNRPQFAFYHEMVHAYHNDRGDVANDGHGHAACVTEYPHEMGNWEFQAVGLGSYAAESVSENAIRGQMGVPLRPTYSGLSWDRHEDPWKQQHDAEEPPLHSPRR
jgi:hypothetical protein